MLVSFTLLFTLFYSASDGLVLSSHINIRVYNFVLREAPINNIMSGRFVKQDRSTACSFAILVILEAMGKSLYLTGFVQGT